MSNAVEASWTLHDARAPGRQVEESLRFDGETIVVGNRRFKVTDLQEPPSVTGDRVEFKTEKLRVVARSTLETRGVGAAVQKAHRNPKAAKAQKGAARRTPTKRSLAFCPSNTLGQGSRPGVGGGGKRGKLMAATAAAAGGAGRGMQRGVGLETGGVTGVMSPGRVRRRQVSGVGLDSDGVEEAGRGRGRRRDDGHEELSDPDEGSSTRGRSSNKTAGSHNASGSIGGGRHSNSLLDSLRTASGGSSGKNSNSNNRAAALFSGPSARKAEGYGGGGGGSIRDFMRPLAGGGYSWSSRPLLNDSVAVGSRLTGTIGGCWRGARQLERYMVHREPVSRREGFRNMGNTCYLNACLQGLLSLSGFVGDLQRKCWVLAMLKPTPPPPPPEENSGGDGGKETAIDVLDSPNPRATAPAAVVGGAGDDGGGDGGKPILYDALLRLSLEAKGSHGLMDASPLKRAMDRHIDRFAGNLQQDAHEFLSDLINVLHDETQPRLDMAAAHVGKQPAGAAESAVAGAGAGETTAAAGGKVAAVHGHGTGAMALSSGEQASKSGAAHGGGGVGSGGVDVGGDGRVVMVDLSVTGSKDEGERRQGEKPDPYGGGWNNDDELAAAAAAAVDAAAAAAAAAGAPAPAPPSAGSRAPPTAMEVLEVDSDSDDDGGSTVGVSSSTTPLMPATPTLQRGAAEGHKAVVRSVGVGKERDGEEGRGGVVEPAVVVVADGDGEAGEERRREEREEERDLALGERGWQRERLMPTTRHFHAEVEVTLTCTRCSYSRRRRELYRDFSLDIPDPSVRQQQQTKEGGGGGKGGATGLESLLEGFFQPSELNLLCERCGHDRVRAEHSLAELPGALILHIKRFKPVVNMPVAASGAASAKMASSSSSPLPARDSRDDAAGVAAAGNSDGDLVTPPVADGGGGNTGESGQSFGSTHSYGGVSYVKLMAPVSVPLELSLERFCTDFTGNAAPAQGLDLGEAVDSLDGLAGIPSVSAAPAGGATGRGGRSAGAAGAAATGIKNSSSDGITVDLSLREGWVEGGTDESEGVDDPFRFPSPLRVGREGEGGGGAGSRMGARGRPGGAGAASGKKPGSVLRDSTNSGGGAGGVVGGVRETATEKRRRVQKEKENAAASAGRDRWSDQDMHHHKAKMNHKQHTAAGGVRLDANKNVDYLATLSSGNNSSSIAAAGGSPPAAGRAVGLFPLGGGSGAGGGGRGERISSGGSGRLLGDRPGFPSSTLPGADAVSGTRLMQMKRKRQQEIDDREREQVAAAIAASQMDTSALRGARQGVDDDDADLARAIHMSMSQEEPERSGNSGDPYANRKWVCPACTLENDGSSGSSECLACFSPKPELLLGAPSLDAVGVGPASGEGEGMDGAGGEGGGGEEDEVELVGDERAAGETAVPSPAGGRTQDQRLKQQQQQQQQLQSKELDQESEEREGEGGSSGPFSPETRPRIPRKGPLSARYELRGILHHLGPNAFAGHYVTDVRQEESNSGDVGGGKEGPDEEASAGKGGGAKGRGWKRHDDSVVSAVPEAKALDGGAQRTCYICFYSLVVG